MTDSFKARSTLKMGSQNYTIFSLAALERAGLLQLEKLPFSIRILLENLLRNEDDRSVRRQDIEALAAWDPAKKSPPKSVAPACRTGGDPPSSLAGEKEIAFTPARVILQDFTGVPTIVDLAAMRDAIKKLGVDPKKINPLCPADLVIDHSVIVDFFGTSSAFQENTKMEFERNFERYQFLRWGQVAFNNFRVVPPGTGIVHQVNLEYLASVVIARTATDRTKAGAPAPALDRNPSKVPSHSDGTKQSQIASSVLLARNDEVVLYPDTLVGTDSHTTMINGLGVVGWGVGGIEAEAAMLGQPISLKIPEVVGFKLTGTLPEGATATDVVLTVTQMLRKKGVVEKFVEFFGRGLDSLSLPDRATIANMAPEYGATIGFFPVDQETLNYLRLTGRGKDVVSRVEAYCKEQKIFRTKDTPDPSFSDTLELDLATVEPSLAGPKRPQDRVPLKDSKRAFREALFAMVKDKMPPLDPKRINGWFAEGGSPKQPKEELMHGETLGDLSASAAVKTEEKEFQLRHGSVVIAAITSCTNTSNPAVMLGAGILAKKAVERGLSVKPWVKTSLAPGSKVVMEYLRATKLQEALEKLRFNLVGFGCTTCIGNSGPLPEPIGKAVLDKDLVAVAVLSGNRNFEGRINPLVRANYLASPPLVVAYAIAGTADIDLYHEPLGEDTSGKPVFLKDIWPSQKEIQDAMKMVSAKMFQSQYAHVFEGDENWRAMKVSGGDTFAWDSKSTYIKNPPYFENFPKDPAPLQDIKNARVLVKVGDSVTTDHISPAGSIPKDSPAGKYLIEHGVLPKDFNSYGARRGNHEVMIRGTFANIRLKNLLAPGTEGDWTRYFPPSPTPLPEGEPASPVGGGKGKGHLMRIFDAAMKYQKENVPLIVLAGKEYGAGSSRDWAAKGPALLGVRAAIAESFERIHRSNLIGMGILPLEYEKGQTAESLGLTGEEIFSIEGIAQGLKPGTHLTVKVQSQSGEKKVPVLCRIDTPVEVSYYQHGGILPYVLRQLLKN